MDFGRSIFELPPGHERGFRAKTPRRADDDHDRVNNLDHLTADQRAKVWGVLATIQRLAGPKGEPD
jgi:hypothetical protein